ncbi:sigma-70 family RNA polymerase sigma factor [Chitinophaga sp.]|uniref:sigma-70 family RNA polymerase sigma factor n=1 Tax=Chitinophaga sp. TaxID=1869181 RepID=UPI002F94DFCD
MLKDYQTILFPYAYNILGAVEDAKDAIQDVLYNYLAASKEHIDNEKNYLIKSVINRALNIKQKKKQVKLGDVWLPEPVTTEGADTNINLHDVASYSMLVLMEQLNPKERAVFILKESFGYSHEEIAEVLAITVEGSRKLLSRARTRLHESRQPATNRKKVPSDMLNNFIHAIRSRDTATLENLLSRDVTFFADGGSKMNVVKKISIGLHEVAALLLYIYEKYDSGFTIVQSAVNHQPALLYYNETVLVACQILGVSAEDGKIFQVSNVVDPDKLKSISLS